jgi:hypothetical protein
MTVSSIAPPTTADALALALAAESGRWVRGYRKTDGLAFWAIPGSNGHVYNATAQYCTCPSAQHRPGPCKHSRAVALVEAQEPDELSDEQAGLATDAETDCAFAAVAADHEWQAEAERNRRRPIRRYEDLFPESDFG